MSPACGAVAQHAPLHEAEFYRGHQARYQDIHRSANKLSCVEIPVQATHDWIFHKRAGPLPRTRAELDRRSQPPRHRQGVPNRPVATQHRRPFPAPK